VFPGSCQAGMGRRETGWPQLLRRADARGAESVTLRVSGPEKKKKPSSGCEFASEGERHGHRPGAALTELEVNLRGPLIACAIPKKKKKKRGGPAFKLLYRNTTGKKKRRVSHLFFAAFLGKGVEGSASQLGGTCTGKGKRATRW